MSANDAATPPGWERSRLGDLVGKKSDITDGPFGSRLKTEHYTPTGPRVVRLQNIGNGTFINSTAHISEDHFFSLGKHDVLAGDVLIASLGEILPRACVAPASLGPAIVKADCLRMRPAPGVDPHFVAHMLNSPQIRSGVGETIKGVGRPRVNLADMRALVIPVPPVAEQKRIAVELDRRLSHVDQAVAGLRSAGQRLADARRALLEVALRGELEDASCRDEVEMLSLSNLIVSLRNGIFVSRPGTEPRGTPILRISSVRPLHLDLSDIRYFDADTKDYVAFHIRDDDLLLIRYNGNLELVGACARARGIRSVLVYPDKLIRVVADQTKVLPAYLEMALNAGPSRRAIRSAVKTTSGQAGISGSDLKQIPVPIPPLECQARIVTEMERRLSLLDAASRSIEANLKRAERLRKSLLGAAFSGKLVPQDSADEPAGALLARIRVDCNDQSATAIKGELPERRATRKKRGATA